MRILADSSAWIDFFRGADTAVRDALRHAIIHHEVLVGDLILVEVLRGAPNEIWAGKLKAVFANYAIVDLCGTAIAHSAAEHFRTLGAKGITMRGTLDVIIGTWCIANSVPLLHADRDFSGMEEHLGLRCWRGAE